MVYGMEDLLRDCSILAERLKDKRFDQVLAIAKGGLFPAALLMQKLGIKKLSVMGVSNYGGPDNNIRLNRPELDYFHGFDFGRTLVVDDLSDSGRTLAYVVQLLQRAEVTTATLHVKKGTIFVPDYYVSEVEGWVTYFWEQNEH